MKQIALRVVTLVWVGAVAAVSFALIASASHVDATDPNDTRGLLDVRTVDHLGRSRPGWKVFTFSSWSRQDIFDSGYITVLLDTRQTARPDYYILVGSMGTHLYADLWRDRERHPDFRVAAVKVWRPNNTSVAVRVPLKRMVVGEDRIFYRWSIETIFTGERCTRVCFDNVPDDGAVVEPLPVRTPTPTPTVSPTVSPTVTITPSPSPTE